MIAKFESTPMDSLTYNARVLLDSVSPAGVRLTTMEVTFPRFILAEINTHRVFSRSSASSRAVPTRKMIERVMQSPVLPAEWGKNQPGMSASEAISPAEEARARELWLHARDVAVETAQALAELKVHKQVVNRVLEPFLWHTAIVSATEWENFFALRCAPNAQPEMQAAAKLMRSALSSSNPRRVEIGAWHLPLVQDDERGLDPELQKQISVARCARVSYLTHEGKRDVEKDVQLFARLKDDRHLSPFEHVATPSGDASFHANFRGWKQMRAGVEATLERHVHARA
jgi:thymidylate synthase ThyX